MRKRKFFLAICAMFLFLAVLNGILFYTTQCSGEYLQSKNVWRESSSIKVKDYLRQKQIIDKFPEDAQEALETVDAIIAYYEKIQEQKRKWWSIKENEEEPSDEEEMLSEYISLVDVENLDIDNYQRVRKCLLNVIGYKDYIQGISDNADAIANSLQPIYADALLLKNILRCKQDYYGMEYLQLSVSLDDGIKAMLGYHVTDLLVFLFLVMYTAALFYYVKTDTFGEQRDFRKTVVGAIAVMVLSSACFYLLNMAIVSRVFGFVPFSMPIQSLEEFYTCPFKLSVGMFFIVYIGMKILAFLLLLGILLLAVTGRHKVIYGIAVSVLLGFEFWRSFAPARQTARFFWRKSIYFPA